MDIRKNKDKLKDIIFDFSEMLKLLEETRKAEKEAEEYQRKEQKAYGGFIEKEIRQQPSLRELLISEYRKKLKDGGSTTEENKKSLQEVINSLKGQLSLTPSEYELLDKLLYELRDKYGGK